MALAAIYLRLSRNEEQLDIDEILSHHRQALIKLAVQHNLSYDIYQEISSGVNTERPQLNSILHRLDEYDYLLVMDIDRISRDNAYAEQIKQMLIINDIKILTPQGIIDLSLESNEMMFSFQAMMANFEYKQIKKRLGRGRIAAAEQGRWTMSNRVPLGYEKGEDKRLIIVEEEAKIIRHIFQKTLERYSNNEIARQLDLLGWRSRDGKVLTSSHISNIRRNVVYRGVVQAKRRVNGRVVDEVFVENAHEAIVSEQEWLEVQKLLEINDNKKFFNKAKASRKLQNLIYCNSCGRKRYLQCDKTGTDYVKSCNYKIDNNKCQDKGHQYLPIEHFVLKKVKEKKLDFEAELKKLKTLDTTNLEEKLLTEKTSLEKQLEKCDKRQKNLSLMRMDGEISKAEFLEMRNQNEEQMQQIHHRMDAINVQLENMYKTDGGHLQLERFIETLNRLDTLEPEACNMFLKTFIKKIWFSSNAIVNYDTKEPRVAATIKIEWK
ncbi:MAG: recombinase family protein [Bacillus sp. (in: firmicutes)]